MFDNLLLVRDGAVAVATVNRPHVLNALNGATLRELGELTQQLKDDASVRAVVLTGAGERAFVAGADIKELSVLTPAEAAAHARLGQRVMDAIEDMGKPVIAAINGFALGGGCELAMACTIRIAAAPARLGQPEVNLGLLPGFGGTHRLMRLVGRGLALEMLLTGRHLTADEAARAGLVNAVVPADALMSEAMAMAASLAGKAPLAVRYLLDTARRSADQGRDDAQVLEATMFGLAASTADMREGARAFLEKRPPLFRGE